MAKANTELEKAPEVISSEIIHSLVINGDLSKMSPDQKVDYYNRFCQSLGLNSLTQPFQLITFQGKQRLYATKDCTEQLRKIHGVSITDVSATELRGVYVVTAKAVDKFGKQDAATGVVAIENLKGEALANALMKAETKSKRRVTLSICGLGIFDESETDSIGQHTIANVAEVMAEKMSGSTKLNNNKTRAELAETEYVEPIPTTEFHPATINQKMQILLLLNVQCIKKDEKEKMVAMLPTMSSELATSAIARLNSIIKERGLETGEVAKGALISQVDELLSNPIFLPEEREEIQAQIATGKWLASEAKACLQMLQDAISERSNQAA